MIEASPVWLELGADVLERALAELWLDEPFSQSVAALMRTVEGRMHAYVPKGTGLDRARAFATGGLLSENERHRLPDGGVLAAVPSLIEARDRLFLQRLADDPRAICILPDLNPRPNDRVRPSEATAFWVNDRCFHWLDHSTDAETFVETIVDVELPWNALAVICRPQGRIGKQDVVDETGLRLLGEFAVEVSIRAYDGESFLIWSREGAVFA